MVALSLACAEIIAGRLAVYVAVDVTLGFPNTNVVVVTLPQGETMALPRLCHGLSIGHSSKVDA